MKKILFAIVIFCSLNAFAQSESTFSYTEFHEPKINVGYLILGNFDVTYEYLLNEESGVGVNLMVPFDDYVEWNINYNLTGYYRFYFGDNYADGFFGEVFANLNSVEDRIEVEGVRQDKDITDLALGFSGGYKLVSSGGVVLEVFLGGGRNLFSEYNSERNFDFVLRAGLNVGYRF
ncbi:hypothetical protein ES731_05550 [Psychroflexus gondwanensis]|jgi:hypothetical protein|uniref:DUF3575 domain-containing protein n=1 Tax=Psychroflexus gondwanensis ACAM 44 TaxID=1189619 RepID=N1WNY9_9FLAO|nr:hypothetical protein [Psychroflexus gondwanensis]EMY81991.1 hypothetical protein pgond44_05615 [Psychroflexus gondwanensis ACAM 44]TXE20480.1 hypothetical protein ES731_05550 [Psychroflexus gondwanensis]